MQAAFLIPHPFADGLPTQALNGADKTPAFIVLTVPFKGVTVKISVKHCVAYFIVEIKYHVSMIDRL